MHFLDDALLPENQQKLVIQVAPYGPQWVPGDSSDIPVTMDDQIQKAVDCYNAGATVLHVHVREIDGKGSKRLSMFNEMLARLRQAVPQMVLQVGGSISFAPEGDGAEHPGAVPQSGRNQIVVDLLEQGGDLQITIQLAQHGGAHGWQQTGTLHHPAAENDAARRQGGDNADQTPCEGFGHIRPGGMTGGQGFGPGPPPGGNGRATDITFQAGVMEGALAAGIHHAWSGRNGDLKVTHLGMQQAMQGTAVDDGPPADAGADGEVNQRINALSGTPEGLAEGSRIHIGVKAHRHAKPGGQGTGDIGLLPAGLGGGSDITIARAGRVQLQGAEGADADGLERSVFPGGLSEPLQHCIHGLPGCGGGDADRGAQVIGSGAEGEVELGAAGFNGGNEGKGRSHEGMVVVSFGGFRPMKGCCSRSTT